MRRHYCVPAYIHIMTYNTTVVTSSKFISTRYNFDQVNLSCLIFYLFLFFLFDEFDLRDLIFLRVNSFIILLYYAYECMYIIFCIYHQDKVKLVCMLAAAIMLKAFAM